MKDKAMEVLLTIEIIEKNGSGNGGRVFILTCVNGTEPLLRVMAEAPTHEEVDTSRYHCCSCSSRNRTLTPSKNMARKWSEQRRVYGKVRQIVWALALVLTIHSWFD